MIAKEVLYFNFAGEVASKKNNRLFNMRSRKLLVSERYRTWELGAAYSLKRQIDELPKSEKERLPIKAGEIINIHFVFCHRDKRRRDSDNQVSSILDLLVKMKILVDDSWDVVTYYTVDNHLAKSAGCYIEITLGNKTEKEKEAE